MSRFISLFAFLIALSSGCLFGQTDWLMSTRSGDEARFLYGSRIARYDLAAREWLPDFTLPRSGATAMAADESGIVVAYGTSLYHSSADLSGERLIGSVSQGDIHSVFLDGNLVIAVHSQDLHARTTVFDRVLGGEISTKDTYVDSLFGASHGPATNRLYGRTQGVSPSDIVTASYSDDGEIGFAGGSRYHGDYPHASKTWIFPDEGRVVDSSGTVYTAPDLRYFGSFGGTISDLAFNGDVPIVLSGGELIAFTPMLLEAGREALDADGRSLHVAGDAAFVFSPGTVSPSLQIVPLTAINAPEPGAPVDPAGLAYEIDDVFQDKDGNLLLLSKGQMSIFKWSPVERKYLSTIPIRGAPKYAAYSGENDALYFAYESQALTKLDLSATTLAESPFATLPAQPNGLATAGEFIFASDSSGAWETHHVISPAGIILRSADWNHYSRVWEWDPAKRRMYFFRDGISPNDLHFEMISPGGLIMEEGETPYHGDLTVAPPIRVKPGGEKVVIGSGVVFETVGMTMAAHLGNGFSDAVWFGQDLVTIRSISGLTQLQTWTGNQFIPGSTIRQFTGSAVRLLPTEGGLVLVTSVEGTPRFTLLDPQLETVYVSPSQPVAPGDLAITGRDENSVSLSWHDHSDNEDGFAIEYRTGSETWVRGATAPAGATGAVVTGLSPATNYHFRVIATLDQLVSTPSAEISAVTLDSPDHPIGEPYHFRITRVFDNRIVLEWEDNATNETGFRIYRATSPAGPEMILLADANATTFTDSDLLVDTTYYYRIEVRNGSLAGDLSGQISARTSSAASAPSAPKALHAEAVGTHEVTLTWQDQSLNEDEFVVERRTSSALDPWVQIGAVSYNVTSFTDTTAAADRSYSYRVRAINSAGSSTGPVANATTPKLGGEFSALAMRAGNIHYFAFSQPNRIERYHLIDRAWLPPISLDLAANALWIDETAIFVAEGRTIVRFDIDGANRRSLINSQDIADGIFTLGDTLVVQDRNNHTTLDKRSGTVFATFNYGYSGTGHSTLPSARKVFFRSIGVSPSDIHALEIGPDGKMIAGGGSPHHGDYPDASRTYLFPNEARVVDDSGTVYSTDSLIYNNTLGGRFTDLSFFGSDIPIVLRGNELTAYNGALLESGSFTLEAEGLRVSVVGVDALVFIPDGATERGLRVQTVPLAELSVAEPGQPIDPRGIPYTPDEVIVDKLGNILLPSKEQLSLFRWSPAQKDYLPTLPLRGAPSFTAYSAETHRIHFAYDSQVVRMMDLSADTPREVPLFNLPTKPRGFALAAQFPYVAAGPGLMTFTPDGRTITTGESTYYTGRHNTWDPVMRRVYHFRDSTSPNDLHYDTIDATGRITGGGETPYHGDFTATTPIRVSPDGSRIVIGSGVVFAAEDLTKVASLANGISDAAWLGDTLFTARSTNGVTQIQSWIGRQYVSGGLVRQFTGTPLRLLTLAENQLLLVTSVEGIPRFVILSADLNPIYISPTRPSPPTNLAVAGRTTTGVSLRWEDASDNEDEFRVEYRITAGDWQIGAVVHRDVTGATVEGLVPGTTYEFRVTATVGTLASEPSQSLFTSTLTHEDQPTGEPYYLTVTRIFRTSITLEWQNNSSPDTGFRVLRSTTPSGPATEFVVPAGTTRFNSTGLAPGTSYHFRVQAFNNELDGDVSDQVSATTLRTDTSPAAPSLLKAIATDAGSVQLDWVDNSSNEVTFLVERAVSSETIWRQVGRVAFNTTSFTDKRVTPGTRYSYRVTAINNTGASAAATASVTTPRMGGDFSGLAMRHADVHYFALSGPDRIERYNLAERQWLTPIPLEAPASALWVDEAGVYVAEDRAVVRFSTTGGDRTPLGNGEGTVRSLFTVGNVLVFGSNREDHTTMDKTTGLFLATLSYGYHGSWYSSLPGMNRVFFRSTNVSPSDIHYLEIDDHGKLVSGDESIYHGDYPGATRAFVFPDGARVVDDSGTVYATDTLTYLNSLGGSFTDISFHGQDIPIVLRGSKLSAYNNALFEVGSVELDAPALRVAVAEQDAIVFSDDGASLRGLSVQVIPLSQLSAPVPGGPVDPRGLTFTPDDIFVDRDGNFLLFSKAHLSLFRWSTQERAYLPTLSLLGSPSFAAYSTENHRAYFAYGTQLVRELDLAAKTPAENLLFTLPGIPTGLATMGKYIFAVDPSGIWTTHYTFSSEGEMISSADLNYRSRVFEWDPVRRKMYFFRDDATPNDLHFETFNAAGEITGAGETPYHGSIEIAPPIRVSPDGSHLVLGSGIVFETDGLTEVNKLSHPLVDALWTDTELLTLRASGAQTLLERRDASNFSSTGQSLTLPGTPLRLLRLAEGRVGVVTLDRGMPRFTLLRADLSMDYDYLPDAPRLSGAPPPAIEGVPFEWRPETWQIGNETSPLTISPVELPAWLSFADGLLTGTPSEADSGDQVERWKEHPIVLRITDSLGRSEERTFIVTAHWTNDAPTFSAPPQPHTADATGVDTILDLGLLLSDTDRKDVHHWEIIGNSNPDLFRSTRIDDSGRLTLSYAPYVSGTSTLDLRVTDASGEFADSSVMINLPELPEPSLTATSELVINRQTGLYEQAITVTNTAGRAIGGFNLLVSSLREGVFLYNGSSVAAGGGSVAYRQPLAAGASVRLILEYYAPERGEVAMPDAQVKLALPTPSDAPLSATDAFAIDALHPQPDGAVLIQFSASPGGSYQIEYSDDFVFWKKCPVPLKAAANRVQWLDQGPPWTQSSPRDTPKRIYRIRRLE